ncbi:MAG: hypothetical protein HC872_00985 [Gammaproteobacteria bacterium]|nr:hypothetical protein [Gammaproteobacteria bacterium]
MGRISELFPATRWPKIPAGKHKGFAPIEGGGGIDPNAPTWFGKGEPEFQLSADIDGNFKNMMVSRAERHEIRLRCRRLGLVCLDIQANSLLGMLFRQAQDGATGR